LEGLPLASRLEEVCFPEAVQQLHLGFQPIDVLFLRIQDAGEKVSGDVIPYGFAMGDPVPKVGNGLVL
jgi:hypothetical protein